jgi:hypothetical protein
MSVFESDHPFTRGTFTTPSTYSYTVPDWPGGTNTIYMTFGLNTICDPWPEDGGVMVVSTDLDSHSFSGVQAAGYTLALSSSDGVITVDLTNSFGTAEFYGFDVISLSLTAPADTAYMLGNPNATDYPRSARDDPGPGMVSGDIDSATPPLRLLPWQVGAPYSYQMRFPNCDTPTFSITAGALPPGLSMTVGGLISGTPTGGSGVFTVAAVCTAPADPSAIAAGGDATGAVASDRSYIR